MGTPSPTSGLHFLYVPNENISTLPAPTVALQDTYMP